MASPLRQLLSAAALGLAALCAAPAYAGPYSSLFIFGDSLSDSGNNALATAPLTTLPNGVPQLITGNTYIPSFPYMPQPGWNNAAGFATYSNGNTWATSFAAQLGTSAMPSLAGGTNFAFGGARTSVDGSPNNFPPSLNSQVAMALGAPGPLDSDALYVVAGGGNDARDVLGQVTPTMTLPEINNLFLAAAAQFAFDIDSLVDKLQLAGAKDIVVWNVPNLGIAPAVTAQGPTASFLGSTLAAAMNAALELALQDDVDVSIFDLFGLVTAVDSNPGAFGLVNTNDACGAASNNCSPSTALFWDGIHPTAAGHQLIAAAMFAQVVPEPGSVWLVMAGLVGMGQVLRRRAA